MLFYKILGNVSGIICKCFFCNAHLAFTTFKNLFGKSSIVHAQHIPDFLAAFAQFDLYSFNTLTRNIESPTL